MALTEAPRLTAESPPIVGFLIAVKQISNPNLGSQPFCFEKSLPVGQRKPNVITAFSKAYSVAFAPLNRTTAADASYLTITLLSSSIELILNYFRAQKLLSSGVVEGLNNKAKVTMRKSYGFRTFRCLELALYHSLGKLPEPESTHDFF